MADIDVDLFIGFLERSDENYSDLSDNDKDYIARRLIKIFDELLFENERFTKIVEQLETLQEEVEHLDHRTSRKEWNQNLKSWHTITIAVQ